MFLSLYADGINFDLGAGVGLFSLGAKKGEADSKRENYFDYAPLLRLGYRWVFSHDVFLEWDFLGLPTALTTFKVGKVFSDQKTRCIASS